MTERIEDQKRVVFLKEEGLLPPKSPTLKLLESANKGARQPKPAGERVIPGILDEKSRDQLWVDVAPSDKTIR